MAGATVRVISGNFVTARPVGIVDGVDFMHSGLVRKVDVGGIHRTLDMGAMVTGISRPYDGQRERELRIVFDLAYRF